MRTSLRGGTKELAKPVMEKKLFSKESHEKDNRWERKQGFKGKEGGYFNNTSQGSSLPFKSKKKSLESRITTEV